MKPELEKKLIKLHRDCFHDGDYAEFFFEHRLPQGKAFVIAENDEPLSACYARFFNLVLEGKTVEIPFLTGVATSPLHRYKGLARKVVERAKHELAKEGYPFLLLHPFDHGFYRKLGFETVNYITRYTPSETAPLRVTFKPMSASDIPLVCTLYASFIKSSSSYKSRDLNDSELLIGNSLKHGGFGYIIYENGIPKGYVWCEDGVCAEGLAERLELFDGCPIPDGYTVPIMGGNEDYSMGTVLNVEALFRAIPYVPNANGDVSFETNGISYKLTVKDGDFYRLTELSSEELEIGERELIAICLGQGKRFENNPFKDIIPSYNLACYETY